MLIDEITLTFSLRTYQYKHVSILYGFAIQNIYTLLNTQWKHVLIKSTFIKNQ